MGRRDPGIDGKRALDQLGCFRGIALLETDDSETMEGIERRGWAGQNSPVRDLRLIQPARAMQPDRAKEIGRFGVGERRLVKAHAAMIPGA